MYWNCSFTGINLFRRNIFRDLKDKRIDKKRIDGSDSWEGVVKKLSLYKDLSKSIKVEDQECPTTIWRGRRGAWFLMCDVSSVRDFQMETVMEKSWDLIKQAPNPPTCLESSCFSQLCFPRHTFFLTMPAMTLFKQLVKIHLYRRKEVKEYSSKKLNHIQC